MQLYNKVRVLYGDMVNKGGKWYNTIRHTLPKRKGGSYEGPIERCRVLFQLDRRDRRDSVYPRSGNCLHDKPRPAAGYSHVDAPADSYRVRVHFAHRAVDYLEVLPDTRHDCPLMLHAFAPRLPRGRIRRLELLGNDNWRRVAVSLQPIPGAPEYPEKN